MSAPSKPFVLAQPSHLDRFRGIIASVTYKDWLFHIGGTEGHWYLQVRFPTTDVQRPNVVTEQHGRKWWLSSHMTESEILQTALMAVLAAEEHEARERFLVEGVAVAGPHFDWFALIHLERAGLLGRDARE